MYRGYLPAPIAFESLADMNLCIADLAKFTSGAVRMAVMPPRDGSLAIVRRVVISPDLAKAGDVYWRLAPEPGDVERAFFHGALGVVCAAAIEPWPGCFSLQVDHAASALARLVERSLEEDEQFFDNHSELKVLQLCAARRTDISSPTCGRSANEQTLDRCRRQAA
jgi:hypothetical protein